MVSSNSVPEETDYAERHKEGSGAKEVNNIANCVVIMVFAGQRNVPWYFKGRISAGAMNGRGGWGG